MRHGEIKLNIQSKPTVAPQSPALAISGLTPTSITTALRKRRRGGGWKKWWREDKQKETCFIKCNKRSSNKYLSSSLTLPVQHHTCSHPVCGHYEDTAKEREHYLSIGFQVSEFLFKRLDECTDLSGLLLPGWSLLCRSQECHSR